MDSLSNSVLLSTSHVQIWFMGEFCHMPVEFDSVSYCTDYFYASLVNQLLI